MKIYIELTILQNKNINFDHINNLFDDGHNVNIISSYKLSEVKKNNPKNFRSVLLKISEDKKKYYQENFLDKIDEKYKNKSQLCLVLDEDDKTLYIDRNEDTFLVDTSIDTLNSWQSSGGKIMYITDESKIDKYLMILRTISK